MKNALQIRSMRINSAKALQHFILYSLAQVYVCCEQNPILIAVAGLFVFMSCL